jgi:hypothetical protein
LGQAVGEGGNEDKLLFIGTFKFKFADWRLNFESPHALEEVAVSHPGTMRGSARRDKANQPASLRLIRRAGV